MRGLILGTGPSLSEIAHLIPKFKGLVFGPNNTYKDFPLDVWLACDPAWHTHFGQVDTQLGFDCWHWDFDICTEYGYRHVEGVWHDGLWLKDKTKISLNHCSGAQLLNLAANQYGCDEIILVGHDFHYNGKQRHYFSGLSEIDGEYPTPLRKHSKFIKDNGQDDLLAVYKRIADTPNRPEIINCTEGSALPWFPYGTIKHFI